jgi:hypothetical protein
LLALKEAILQDPQLFLAQQKYLLSELEIRFENGEFDDFDDGDFAAWVREEAAPGPKGRPGAAAAEEPDE